MAFFYFCQQAWDAWCGGLSAGVVGGGGDGLVTGRGTGGLDPLLGSLDEGIMARYS